jgi:arylsulfatase
MEYGPVASMQSSHLCTWRDFPESRNIVRELTALFWAEAEKYQVTPLFGEIAFLWGFPKYSTDRTKFTYYSGTENISYGMIPPIYNRSYSISADLYNPGRSGLAVRPGIAGVIVAEGSFLGGFSLYVEGGRLKHTYSVVYDAMGLWHHRMWKENSRHASASVRRR